MAKAIPDGMHSVSPHLTIDGAAAAIDFYKKAFDATEQMRIPAADGKRLLHAAIRIGDSAVLLNDSFPEWGGNKGPKELGGTAVTIHLYVEDCDAVFARAVEAGATVAMPLADMFWGDRYGTVIDPFGHHWSIATHKQDLTPEQIAEAAKAAMAKMGKD
jgi:PhnB protein